MARPGWTPTMMRWAGVALAGLAVGGCHAGDSLDPSTPRPPYIAVVPVIETGALPDPALKFDYRIRDVSAGGTLDTVVTLAPTDTLILSVHPATYQIELGNLPKKCVSKYGTTDVVVVPEGINTAVSRFYINCDAPLSVVAFTLGGPDRFQFVWALDGQDGSHRTGFIEHREEAVIVNPLPPGTYVFSIWSTPSACEFTSPGRRSQTVVVPPKGGARLQFVITCSEEKRSPVLSTFRWTYHDGAVAFYADGHDEDGNLIGYAFDLTDCSGHSILPGGEMQRGGLQSWATYRNPDPVIVAAFDVNLSDQELAGRCAALRLIDDFGNTSPFAEVLPNRTPGSPPFASAYNAVFAGETRLVTRLDASDTDGDYVGAFVTVTLRDGTLGQLDGKPDVGLYNNQGFLTPQAIPDLPLGGRILFSDVYAQNVYLIDRQGRFTRLVDGDPFR